MIEIKLNGEIRRLQKPLTVAALLGELELQHDSVAVELNETIVPRSRHDQQQVCEGDRIEIVRAIGGG